MSRSQPMPDWLIRRLGDRGQLNPDRVGRAARTVSCPDRCGAVVVRGLDGDRCALAVTVDPQPLTAVGEFLALAAGRPTYELAWRGDRYEIDQRDQWRIRGHPPEAVHAVVAHRCGSVPLGAGYRPDPTSPLTEYPDDPPF